MNERSRQKMIDSINRLTGRGDCTEAVLFQRRSTATLVASVVAFAAISAILRSFGLGAIIAAALAGCVLGLALTAFTESFLLGSCADVVVLAHCSRFKNEAAEIIIEVEHPQRVEIASGVLNRKVAFRGEDYLMARGFEKRLRAMIGHS